MVYGRNPVREALRGRRAHTLSRLWATRTAADEPWLQGRDVDLVDASELERICGSDEHQGVCAELGPYPYAGAAELLGRPDPLIVALDQIQDPQNLGAICRSAECAGVDGVVIPERRAAAVTAAVAKASAGAVEHLRVARVRNVSDFLLEAKEAGCWCYGADAGGDTPYDAVDYRGGVVLVLGGEGRGLRRRVADTCDARISLPLRGHVESLNVGAAAAIVLYRILHVRS